MAFIRRTLRRTLALYCLVAEVALAAPEDVAQSPPPAPPPALEPAPPPALEPAPPASPPALEPALSIGLVPSEPSAGACPEGWATVLERSKRAAVWVETPFNGLAGVLVSAQRVVTHTTGIEPGRGPLRVRFADNRTLEATVVQIDAAASIAVLQLEAPVQFAPLEVGDPAQLRPGTEVLIIAQPTLKYSGEKTEFDRFLPVPGLKGGQVADRFAVAAHYEEGALGAPVIGCDGRWYGSVVQLGSTMIVENAGALSARAERGQAEGYDGGWEVGASRIGLVLDFESERGLLGVGTGFSLVGYDALDLRLEYGALAVTSSRIPVSAGARFFADLSLGYRVLLAGQPKWYLVPAIGIGAVGDSFDELMQQADPECRGLDCTLEPRPRLNNEGHGGRHYFGRLAMLAHNTEYAFALRFGGERGTSGHFTIAFGQL